MNMQASSEAAVQTPTDYLQQEVEQDVDQQDLQRDAQQDSKAAPVAEPELLPIAPMQHLPSDLYWYSAPTSLGEIYVGVEAPTLEEANRFDPTSIIGKASLLARAEPMVQTMEFWQSIELDLTPAQMPVNHTLAMRLQRVASPVSLPTYFVFEAQAYSQLKPIPTDMAKVIDISALNVSHKLRLDSVSLSQAEYDALEEGALVLMPSSFNENWFVTAYNVNTTVSQSLQFSINAVSQTLTVGEKSALEQHLAVSTGNEAQSETQHDVNDSITIDIALSRSVPLPLESLLGSAGFEQALSLHNADITISQHDQLLATGTLCQVGRGYGVVIGNTLEVEA